MFLFEKGSEKEELHADDLKTGLISALEQLGGKKKVLLVPPDITRLDSGAGALTRYASMYYEKALSAILPATGTHFAMTSSERTEMFGNIPQNLFLVHDWQTGVKNLGYVPAHFIGKITKGRWAFDWPVQVNRTLVEGGFDLILSLGQVVPHEVTGMANFTKNILIGTGGAENIHSSHFISALCGIEQIMGRVETPVRKLLDYAAEKFLADLPIVYVLTVVESVDKNTSVVRGLFIGDDRECFLKAAELSRKVNITYLEKPLKKAVVYLDAKKYKSAWLGNKSIYRTRMALAEGAELIVLAPGMKCFAEDPALDILIRKYGYCRPERIIQYVSENIDLRNNLCAAAHLIHGSSADRFTITYCPGQLTRHEIEGVDYLFEDLKRMLSIYNPASLKNGFNSLPSGEEIYYISDPALGLWMCKNGINRD
jgi:nickel-dependent lactate racemase